MHFYKYHALGNDYIVLDPQKIKIKLNEENIKLICHRNFGLGSDGILLGPVFMCDKINLHIYNPDGSEAEKSGNGLRIFSKYLIDAGYVKEKNFFVNTIVDQIPIEVLSYDPVLIRIDMGKVTFKSSEIPVSGKEREVVNETFSIKGISYKITCLSIGNPHCVIPLEDISEHVAREIGPLIENNDLFPNRVNVQFLKVTDRGNISIEIWERGAGYTLASGSSSCAAASAAYKLGLVDGSVRVAMPGGSLDIDIDASGHVKMTGTVSCVAEGNFSSEMLAKLT